MADYIMVDEDTLDAVSKGWYYAPHDVLGPHSDGQNVTVRVLRRLADEVYIETLAHGRIRAEHEYNGIWRAVVPGAEVPDYRVVALYGGVENRTDDPYRFLPTLGELDIYLFSEGRHEELWKVMGAHVHTFESELGDTQGTSFSVWAPNALAVRVVGDFNGWDGSLHAMRSLGESGIWEIFIPGAGEGSRYKFEIQYKDLSWHQKADPMARQSEEPPSTASIVTVSRYEWNDAEWVANRRGIDQPISIYEVHLGSWRKGLSYREAADQLIGHVKYMGFTHVEFMPLAEHPYGPSWGYQVTGYYSPTARFGHPDDLRYLIDRLHQAGIGVITDWVPAHFATDAWALANFDGEPLYEDPNPSRGSQPDWGTLVFNYGRRQVRNFLVANALYWIEEFHFDGIRADAVASMLYLDYSRQDGQWQPNIYGGRENLEAIAFLQETNATAYRRNPGIMMIAEESTSWPGVTAMTDTGGLGFGLKWNMGWMNDTLSYLEEKPINRRWHHGEITFSMVYAFSENYLLPLSHDEVVHGKGSLYAKMPGDDWQKRAGLRGLYAYMWSHPGKKLLFMGQEFAQMAEWNHDASLDWWLTDQPEHNGVMSLVKRLNELLVEHPALWSDDFSPHGFEWIDGSDADSNVLTYMRHSRDDDDTIAVAVNFSGVPRLNYRVGLPQGGRWIEILNTDAVEYGGSGVGNLGAVEASGEGWNGQPYSALVQIPPFGAVYLTPENQLRALQEARATEVAEAAEAAAEEATAEAAPAQAAPAEGEVTTAETATGAGENGASGNGAGASR
ncbi:1,4-alpha-glucan branching protein GlgB [Actinobaculum suis]|uniref:1,4-alpha-glucan branching protein GlgB n=1 Tax=Actinobaculum suis TaxID=1657 RepID=UPI0009E23F7D|nr:1,4-alpha-glucan branching protein GlgB [Actinobaculum suis]